ncbi:sodium-dependent neutral amino acid transporter B(0)AT3-like [Actinia tenebrosa]|uniref:Sodium-dependent neutral amino acid transporter B(0)AT3-like n=1 Tax=Actinia tenebrosa TaxID=6105 RepID=A0A6P8J4G2_ACTTE|nr:sodium-dependent neutral amino acid transporter B(0)AT3-like [Actinia tenebrosa]
MGDLQLTTIKDAADVQDVSSSRVAIIPEEKDRKTNVVGEAQERPGWDNKMQFLLAAIGFAVGLGNIWRFPWLCQKNGGGAFLIPYFIMLIFEGIPIFFLELSLGQRMRQGSIQVWSSISPSLGGVGIATTIVCIFVACYYNIVMSWVLFYFVNSFQNPLPWKECPKFVSHPASNNTVFNSPKECLKSSPTAYFFHRKTLLHADSIESTTAFNWKLAVALAVAWVLVYLCVIRGIKSSGKVVYLTATFPYVVLIAFFIRGLLLEGYDVGIKYLFTPKWEKLLDPLVWLDAATQIFFSLGLAFGTIIAYASYNPMHENTLRDAVTISLANCMTSLFASIVVFSILGFRASFMMAECEEKRSLGMMNLNSTIQNMNFTAMPSDQKNSIIRNTTQAVIDALPKCDIEKFLTEAASGPGLAFIAFTDAINQMPGSNFWSVIFFLMLFSLGLDSLFGALESITTALQDVMGFKNIRKELLAGLLCIFSMCMGFSMVTTIGEYVLQMFDSFCANLPLLFIAIMECVGVCYIYGIDRFSEDIEFMTGRQPAMFWKVCWMFITPVAMTTILVSSIVLMSRGQAVYYAWNEGLATYQVLPYPAWSVFIIVVLILSSVIFIPGVALLQYFRNPRSKRTAYISS